MDAIKSWAVSVIISALAGTVVSLLMPKGSMEKTMRAVIGVFMVSAVCLPLAQSDIAEEAEAVFSASDYGENRADSMEEYLVSEYENTVKEAVESAAEESVISDYEVFADISCNDSGCIIIHKITVEIGEEYFASKDAFETLLKEKLGFAVSVRKGN